MHPLKLSIFQIEKGSVAERDGRIKIGDQILQVKFWIYFKDVYNIMFLSIFWLHFFCNGLKRRRNAEMSVD